MWWRLLTVLTLALSLATPALAQHRHGHGHAWRGGYGGGRYFGGGFYTNRNGGLYGGYWPGYGNSIALSVGYPNSYSYSSYSTFGGPLVSGYYNVAPLNVNYYSPYYGTYYAPQSNYVEYYLPPTYFPGELAYGPLALQRFFGWNQNVGIAPAPLIDAGVKLAPRVVAKPQVGNAAPGPVVQQIDWEARQKADKYIEMGDRFFGQQKFYDALLRYKMAVQAAPDFAAAQLRHGLSLIANRRYEEAAAALKRAFALDPQIIKSGFHVDQLYVDNRMVRELHEEALAQAALNAPENGELLWTLGIWLVFNGQPERSVKFFEKAKELGVAAVQR